MYSLSIFANRSEKVRPASQTAYSAQTFSVRTACRIASVKSSSCIIMI